MDDRLAELICQYILESRAYRESRGPNDEDLERLEEELEEALNDIGVFV